MNKIQLNFIVCSNDVQVLKKHLLRSPCIAEEKYPLYVYDDSASAAEAYNAHTKTSCLNKNIWWVWVHQDVYLPNNWDHHFKISLDSALQRWPKVAVAGVYGISQSHHNQRAGRILDRGKLLTESIDLPVLGQSLDELLIATRSDAQLGFDPQLGFDFYGTDVVLEAQKRGWQTVIVDAYCEHWSQTPQHPLTPLNYANGFVQVLPFSKKNGAITYLYKLLVL